MNQFFARNVWLMFGILQSFNWRDGAAVEDVMSSDGNGNGNANGNANGNGRAHQSATGRNNEKRVCGATEASSESDRGCSERHLTAIEMLLRGGSDAQVAEHLGVDRGTVYRWRTSNVAFRAQMQRLHRVVWQQQARRLRAMVGPALDAVQRRLDDPRTSLRAASILLRFAVPRPANAAQRDEEFDDELEEDLEDLDFGEGDEEEEEER